MAQSNFAFNDQPEAAVWSPLISNGGLGINLFKIEVRSKADDLILIQNRAQLG